MENNFRCECGKQFFIQRYISKTSGYFDKFGKQLCCDCGEKLVSIPKTTSPFLLNIGKFNMMSREDKSKALKKRSSEHFKKEIFEVKHEQLKKANK